MSYASVGPAPKPDKGNLSGGVLLLLLILLSLCGCGGQNLRAQVSSLNPGQSKEQVLAVLGPPGNRSFSGNAEAWQYCRTGTELTRDTYATVWFLDGRVHRVTTEQAQIVVGLCSGGYPTIDWGQMDARVTVGRQ